MNYHVFKESIDEMQLPFEHIQFLGFQATVNTLIKEGWEITKITNHYVNRVRYQLRNPHARDGMLLIVDDKFGKLDEATDDPKIPEARVVYECNQRFKPLREVILKPDEQDVVYLLGLLLQIQEDNKPKRKLKRNKMERVYDIFNNGTNETIKDKILELIQRKAA